MFHILENWSLRRGGRYQRFDCKFFATKYYKIIEKVECTLTLKYYIRLLPKLGLQVHFNTMCFLLSTVEGIEVHVSKSKKRRAFLRSSKKNVQGPVFVSQ